MAIGDSIRIKAGHRYLKKMMLSLNKRKAKLININDAKSIALLFKIEDQESYNYAAKFAKFIKGEFGTKRVFLLGYWDDKKENPSYLVTRLDFDFFTKKDLDWKGIPTNVVVENFLQEHFDILIDLNNYSNIPLRYVVLKSNAHLKVGRMSEENKPYFDMMIANNETDFEEYCNQIIKYLDMVHVS